MVVRDRDRVAPVEDARSLRSEALERLRRRRDELAAQLLRLTADYEEVVRKIAEGETGDRDAGLRNSEIQAPARLRSHELGGASIRRVAVKVWLTTRPADAPMHYREWYSLVSGAGHVIVGRDPVASFLTQITRSPLVRHAGRPGEYVLDLEFEQRARQELQSLYADLVQAHRPQEPYSATSEKRREERRVLTARVEQLERAVREVVEVWTSERSEAA